MAGRSRFGTSGLVSLLLLIVGCSGNDEALQADLIALEQRVAELERTSGRYQIQINEIEEEVLLLDDRVEAQRLSLERRGVMATRARTELPAYRPPDSAPDYSYMTELPVQRLEPDPAPMGSPSQEDLEELVITNDTLQRYVDEFGGVPSYAASSTAGTNVEDPVVVGDRLSTSGGRRDQPVARTSSGSQEDALAIYQASLQHFNAGRYGDALDGFEAFLAANPAEDYEDNAYYWIGECHFARGQYAEALTAFESVVRDYPDGNKVPDSLLKIGLTHAELHNREEASQVLATLVESYPTSDAARRASQTLADFN